MRFIYRQLYFCTVVACFAIDRVWLVLVARGFYQKHLGFGQLSGVPGWQVVKVNWVSLNDEAGSAAYSR